MPTSNVVKFNNTVAAVTASTSGSITTSVPAGATNGTITVTIGTQTATSATSFTIPAPTMNSFTPASGQIGTAVTITGTNFSIVPASNVVKFNNTVAAVTASTSTSITTTVPNDATTGTITVTIGTQTATSSTSFTVPAPTITSFTPSSGQIGAAVTITGTNFSIIPANNVVKFNNTTAIVTASTPNTLSTTIPAGATTGTITVAIGTQSATSATSIIITSPNIASFNPISGAIGTTVTITGTNFSNTASNNIVKFNGTVAVITGTPTATSITITVPTGAVTGKITVEVGGQVATSSVDFTVLACAKPPKPIITATKLDTESPMLTSSSATGNQWFLNGTTITDATGVSLNVTTPGVYKVKVTITGGCLSDFSDDFAIIVTGDVNQSQQSLLKYYPNPVEDKLIVETPEIGLKVMQLFYGDGRQVNQLQFEATKIEVDVKNYSTGMYYFIITSEKGTATGKFLKK